MCTAITLHSNQGENLFGRTMDFSYPIEPGLYVIPRNYEWYSLITMKKILIYSSPRKRIKNVRSCVQLILY